MRTVTPLDLIIFTLMLLYLFVYLFTYAFMYLFIYWIIAAEPFLNYRRYYYFMISCDDSARNSPSNILSTFLWFLFILSHFSSLKKRKQKKPQQQQQQQQQQLKNRSFQRCRRSCVRHRQYPKWTMSLFLSSPSPSALFPAARGRPLLWRCCTDSNTTKPLIVTL